MDTADGWTQQTDGHSRWMDKADGWTGSECECTYRRGELNAVSGDLRALWQAVGNHRRRVKAKRVIADSQRHGRSWHRYRVTGTRGRQVIMVDPTQT